MEKMQTSRQRSSAPAADDVSESLRPAMGGRLHLASSSPRRRELVALTGLAVVVSAADADETPRPGESGGEMTRRLARRKAEAPPSGEIVLAADTTVVDGQNLIGKPADADEARRILQDLRGRRHTVVTSIAIRSPDGTVLLDTCESSVPMRTYRDEDIDRYIARGEPFDKAGAYNILDDGFDPVERDAFGDCYANVMGLPLCHVVRTLRRIGVEPAADVPAACQRHLRYDCRVFPSILGDAA